MTSTSPRRRALRAACAATALAVAVAVPVVALRGEQPRLLVVDEGGDTLLTAALPDSGQFEIAYQHSYYDEPAVEHFVAEPTGFRVSALSSPSEAVLDYYDVAGTRSRTADGGHVLVPRTSPELDVLPLIATAKGRRTLVVDGRRSPLWSRDGPRHLQIRLADPSPLRRLLPSL